MIKSQKNFSPKRKLYYDQVISLYREENLGAVKISRIVPVSFTTITRWIRNFVDENPEMLSARMKKNEESKDKVYAGSPYSAMSKDLKAMRSEIARLTKELRKASMRADAYDEMINVAEKKFNIKIRKKAGTKR